MAPLPVVHLALRLCKEAEGVNFEHLFNNFETSLEVESSATLFQEEKKSDEKVPSSSDPLMIPRATHSFNERVAFVSAQREVGELGFGLWMTSAFRTVGGSEYYHVVTPNGFVSFSMRMHP